MESGITLNIKAMDVAGTVIHEDCRENDLYLWNWAIVWAQFFKLQFNQADTTVYEWQNTAGVAKTTVFNDLLGAYHYGSTHIYYGMDRGRVQIGSGQTPPTILDYALEAKVAEVPPSPPVVITDGDVVKVLFTATFTFQEETPCGEVGISLRESFIPNEEILITRDIFSPVTVPSGGSLSLQYELWFNGTPA